MTGAHGFTTFETPIGPCAIAWGDRGVVGVWLPERRGVRARVRRRFPHAQKSLPPQAVKAAIDDLVALLGGERRDLSAVVLDLERVPPFNRRVYEIARTVGPGATITYGEIARRLGDLALARDVGQALGENPFPLVVPCHRVLAANGRLGGFSADGGPITKRRLLAIEGVPGMGQQDLFEIPPTARSACGSAR